MIRFDQLVLRETISCSKEFHDCCQTQLSGCVQVTSKQLCSDAWTDVINTELIYTLDEKRKLCHHLLTRMLLVFLWKTKEILQIVWASVFHKSNVDNSIAVSHDVSSIMQTVKPDKVPFLRAPVMGNKLIGFKTLGI